MFLQNVCTVIYQEILKPDITFSSHSTNGKIPINSQNIWGKILVYGFRTVGCNERFIFRSPKTARMHILMLRSQPIDLTQRLASVCVDMCSPLIECLPWFSTFTTCACITHASHAHASHMHHTCITCTCITRASHMHHTCITCTCITHASHMHHTCIPCAEYVVLKCFLLHLTRNWSA